MKPPPTLVTSVPAFVTPFANIRFNNIGAINGIILPSCYFCVSLTPFPKIPPNNKKAIGAMKQELHHFVKFHPLLFQ